MYFITRSKSRPQVNGQGSKEHVGRSFEQYFVMIANNDIRGCIILNIMSVHPFLKNIFTLYISNISLIAFIISIQNFSNIITIVFEQILTNILLLR